MTTHTFMTKKEILDWCSNNITAMSPVQFPDELFSSLDTETAVEIAKHFSARSFMILPESERQFFDWLQVQDEAVWNDLWTNTEEQPYVVSLAFLPAFLDPSRGFPICDLESIDNYFFVPAMLHTAESKDFVEAVRDRFLAKQKLTVEQLLALESSLAPIDIWHFAWHHGIELQRAKEAVASLVEDNILFHLKKADELATWVE